MADIREVTLSVMSHNVTGLRMAISDDLPGFVVHANSEEELDKKIPLALRSFVKATRGEDGEWVLLKKERAPGFWPPAYIARRQLTTSEAA